MKIHPIFAYIHLVTLLFACSKKPHQAQSKTYVYKDDSLTQTLDIKEINRNSISFDLAVKNKSGSTSSISGIAYGNPNTDPNSQVDSNGQSYPAVGFTYDSLCWLLFDIEMDHQTMITIYEADGCDSLHDELTPFKSKGTLLLRKKN